MSDFRGRELPWFLAPFTVILGDTARSLPLALPRAVRLPGVDCEAAGLPSLPRSCVESWSRLRGDSGREALRGRSSAGFGFLLGRMVPSSGSKGRFLLSDGLSAYFAMGFVAELFDLRRRSG